MYISTNGNRGTTGVGLCDSVKRLIWLTTTVSTNESRNRSLAKLSTFVWVEGSEISWHRLQNTENLPLTSGSQIPVLGEEDHYKFLGKIQNVNQLDKQVFEQAI